MSRRLLPDRCESCASWRVDKDKRGLQGEARCLAFAARMTFHDDGAGCERYEPVPRTLTLAELRETRRCANVGTPGPKPAKEPTPRMRRLARVAGQQLSALVALLVLLFSAPRELHAQDLDLWRVTVDQIGPWELRGPRIGFHAVRAVGGIEAYRALRALRVPPNVAAPAGAVLSGVAPHVIGLARREYPFHAGDWLADAVIGGGTAFVARQLEAHHHRARGVLAYLGAWLVVFPFAEP